MSGNNDVNVTMTAASGQAQQAWLSMIGLIDQMEAKLRRMGTAGATAGRKTADEMSGISRTVQRIGKDFATLVGVGSPLAVMLSTVTLIRNELEAWKQLSQESSTFQLQRASAFAESIRGLGGSRPDSAGKPFGAAELERFVTKRSVEVGVSQLSVLRSLPGAFSAAPQLPPDIVASVPFELADVFQDLRLADKQDELSKSTEAILEIMKSQLHKGVKLTPKQATAGFVEAFRIARSRTLEEFSGPFISFISEMTAKRPEVESFEELAAFVGAVEQAAVDPSGRRSATNISIAAEDVLAQFFQEAPELRKLSFGQMRRAVRDATPEQPKLMRIRQQILGSFAPDLSDEEVRKLGFQKGALSGEQRTKGIIRAAFVKDSSIDKDIEQYEKDLQGIFEERRVNAILSEFKALEQLPIMFPLRQETTRVISEEMGQLAMTEEARRLNILETVGKTLKQAEAGPLGLQTPVNIATSALRVLGSEDPLDIGRAGITRLEHSIEQRRGQLEQPQTLRERQKLERQLQALEAGRAQLLQDVDVLQIEREQLRKAGVARETIAQPQPQRQIPPPGAKLPVETAAQLQQRVMRLPSQFREPTLRQLNQETMPAEAVRKTADAMEQKAAQQEEALNRAIRIAGKETPTPGITRQHPTPSKQQVQQTEEDITQLRQRAAELRTAIGEQTSKASPHELETNPQILRRTPSRLSADRKFEGGYLRGFLEKLMIEEGVPREEAIRSLNIAKPEPRQGQSAADALESFIAHRRQILAIRSKPENVSKLSIDQQQKLEQETTSERRALTRAESVLQGRPVTAPPPAASQKPTGLNRIVEEEGVIEDYFGPDPRTVEPIIRTKAQAEEFINQTLSGLPADQQTTGLRQIAAAATESVGQNAHPQTLLTTLVDAIASLRDSVPAAGGQGGNARSDRLTAVLERLAAALERTELRPGQPAARTSSLPPVLPEDTPAKRLYGR